MPTTITGTGAFTGATTINGLSLPSDSFLPGMVLINTTTFSAASTVSVNNCFSSAYDVYRLVLQFTTSASTTIAYRHRASGTDSTGNTYYNRIASLGASYATSGGASTIGTFVGDTAAGYQSLVSADFGGVRTSGLKTVASISHSPSGTTYFLAASSQNTDSTVFDGITVSPSSGTMTGTLRVYGYRN
jgi:hypothetical protein